jgi:hypothetical protein
MADNDNSDAAGLCVSLSAVEASKPDLPTAAADQLGAKLIQVGSIIADQRRTLDELEASASDEYSRPAKAARCQGSDDV